MANGITLQNANGGTLTVQYSGTATGDRVLTLPEVTGPLANLTGALFTGATGYGTGAGGSVVQQTSRATTVTLNKLSGNITLFSAAGSATLASFTVMNSEIGANDVVILTVKTGATNVYELVPFALGAGSFQFGFKTTGGTAVDAPTINFVVIKGSIA